MDVIDLHRSAFTSTEPEYLRGIKMMCLRLGLPIGYLGVSNRFVGTEPELRKNVEMCKESIDVAAFIGAPLIRVFGGHVPPEIEDREPLFEPLRRWTDHYVFGPFKGRYSIVPCELEESVVLVGALLLAQQLGPGT